MDTFHFVNSYLNADLLIKDNKYNIMAEQLATLLAKSQQSYF